MGDPQDQGHLEPEGETLKIYAQAYDTGGGEQATFPVPIFYLGGLP